MTDTPCLCGHLESEHHHITTNSRRPAFAYICQCLLCDCLEYRPDLTIPLIDLETP